MTLILFFFFNDTATTEIYTVLTHSFPTRRSSDLSSAFLTTHMQATGFMADTLSVTLPDGSVREVAAGTTPADIAASISPGLFNASLAAPVDCELPDIGRPFTAAATASRAPYNDAAARREHVRHNTAPTMAGKHH